MFEVPVDTQETKSEHARIGIAILVLLLIAGVSYYFIAKHGSSAKPTLTPIIHPTGPADPVKDLKIIHASMNKDSMGVTAVWLVTLRNLSNAYTYSEIKYETSYFSADNRQLLVNQGTIKETLALAMNSTLKFATPNTPTAPLGSSSRSSAPSPL